MTTEVDERERWYRKDWMTDDQWECLKMLADLFGGHHHLHAPIRQFGYGISYSTHHRLSTFDFDKLTRLVFMAHDRMIRVEINPSGPGMVKLCLHKRHTREGSMVVRHPTIEDALAMHRKYYPAPVDG